MRRLLCVLLFFCSTIACYATSIIFPAFGRPVVRDEKIYTHHVVGHEVICFDISSKSIKWRTKLKSDQMIHGLWMGLSNEILVYHWGSKYSVLYVLDTNTGQIKEKHLLKGRILDVTENGQVLYEDRQKISKIYCYLYTKKKDIWAFNPQTPEAIISSWLCGEYFFIFVSPTGPDCDEIICLKASDGSLIWREKVPVKQFSIHGSVKEGGNYLLCVSDNVIRLLDKNSGKILKRYNSSVDLNGADFWGDGRIVMCLGGVTLDPIRTIRIIDTAAFKVLSEFQVKKVEVARVDVVGDILLLGSLYREMGVDLSKKKIVWNSYQRHQRIHNGLIYYGEPGGDNAKSSRILGVCEPATGKTQSLYSEPVK